MPKGTGKNVAHNGEETYRYNWVVPLRIFRLVQEVATAEDRTMTMQLIVWVKEGYTRWKVAKEKRVE